MWLSTSMLLFCSYFSSSTRKAACTGWAKPHTIAADRFLICCEIFHNCLITIFQTAKSWWEERHGHHHWRIPLMDVEGHCHNNNKFLVGRSLSQSQYFFYFFSNLILTHQVLKELLCSHIFYPWSLLTYLSWIPLQWSGIGVAASLPLLWLPLWDLQRVFLVLHLPSG